MPTASNPVKIKTMPSSRNDKKFGYRQRSFNWTSLRLLNIYRVAIAALFFSQSFIQDSPLLKIHDLSLYAWSSFAYLSLALVMILSTWIDRRHFQYQVSIQIYIDIFAIIILMHACGGISSGLGMLLIISIAVTGLLGKDSLAIIFASIASVGLLGEHIYASYYNQYVGNSTQVGLLGAALFATALATQSLVKRLRSSEAVIQKQKLDVANLSALNAEILQNMQSGVIALDSQDHVRHINNTAKSMLHSRLKDKFYDHKLPFELQKVLPDLDLMLADWRKNSEEYSNLLVSESGGFDLQVTFRNLESASHHGTLLFLDDISHIKHQMLQSKLASLGQLTANIAHEIRNPLAAISHAAQLLAENKELPSTEQRMTEIIQQHTNRINSIIEDIMMISRGHHTIADTIIMDSFIHQFLDSFCLSGEADSNRFELELEPDLKIPFDRNHLTRILTNLCSNAITHGGSNLPIQIKIYSKQPNSCYIEIADQGKGITAKEMDKIFEPFYTTSHHGTGLGLYIVSQLCEINEAEISVMGNSYGGTSFIIKK